MEHQILNKLNQTETITEKAPFYENPIFITTFGIGTFSGFAYTIKQYIIDNLYEQIKKKFYFQIEIYSQDPLYEQIQNFLIDQGYAKYNSNHLFASLKRENKSWWNQNDDLSMDKEKPKVNYEFQSGVYTISYKKCRIFVENVTGKANKVGWEKKEVISKTLILSTFSRRGISILQELCDEALTDSYNQKKNLIDIYALHRWGGWNNVSSKKPRPFSTVVLDSNKAFMIRDDIVNFQMNEEWYKQRGVPYRRGYLLYGPPGTGKTSFINAIAGDLRLNLCVLSLQDQNLNEEILIEALEQIPSKSIVMLEDVDAIFVQRVSEDQKKNNISFSGLLNALDGIRTGDGRILFMTTNHKEKLDPALLRPGRADLHVELKNSNQDQIEQLFNNFYPENKELGKRISKQLPEYKVSMAALQGHFLKYKKNPQDAVDKCLNLINIEQIRIDQLDIQELLLRINFEKYYLIFDDFGCQNIKDLQKLTDENYDSFKIYRQKDKKQIKNILQSNELDIFDLVCKQQVREKLNFIFSSIDDVEFILDAIEDKVISQYQLIKILQENQNDKIITKQKIKNQIKHNNDYRNQKLSYKYDFSFNVEKWLEQIGYEKYFEKIKEKHYDDPELFVEDDAATFIEFMGIEEKWEKKKFELEFLKLKEQVDTYKDYKLFINQ